MDIRWPMAAALSLHWGDGRHPMDNQMFAGRYPQFVVEQHVHVKWRWDTSDSPAGLPISPAHSTIGDHWAAPPGAVPTRFEHRFFADTRVTAYRLAA